MKDQNSTAPLNGARVLVVENDPFIAADLDLLVEEAGGSIVALSGNRDDALSLLSREPVDAAIVDPELHEGDGLSVIDELKQRNIPFVLCRASSDEVDPTTSYAPSAIVTALALMLKLAPLMEQTQFLL